MIRRRAAKQLLTPYSLIKHLPPHLYPLPRERRRGASPRPDECRGSRVRETPLLFAAKGLSRSERDKGEGSLIAHRSSPRPSGFSLIEVVLAVAVIAVGLMAVIGLFPQGLQSSRDASDNTLSAMIAQDILDDIRRQSGNTTFQISFCSCPSHTWGASSTADLFWMDAQGATNVSLGSGSYFQIQATYNPNSGGIPSLTEAIVTVVWPVPAASAAPPNTNVFYTKIAKYN